MIDKVVLYSKKAQDKIVEIVKTKLDDQMLDRAKPIILVLLGCFLIFLFATFFFSAFVSLLMLILSVAGIVLVGLLVWGVIVELMDY